ncbi:MAG: magnesium transporter [Flavobacteriaceae bacterium]|nr:magnesium transporter [Flavobacteriaceae bacterium]|tara:strand:+ start:8917 stop:10269 length:1353 start_codon:yes stop_codon:yes gene_type:complete
MTPFKLTSEFLTEIQSAINSKNKKMLLKRTADLHYADLAEVINELNPQEATYLVKLFPSEKTADVFTELDEDLREDILAKLTSEEIAAEIAELDTDDAVDIITELDEEIAKEVISNLNDREHAAEIVELLRYDEDTAGGLMAKELIRVNENWSINNCVREMRAQAGQVTRVHSIYVVDDDNTLKGRLSLKDLLMAPDKAHIKDVYIKKVDYVEVNEDSEEVAKIMAKYDLEAIPVVDEMRRLVGRITIDDIVDVIKEEADKDYQQMAGITQDVEASDSILELTKARLPWLIVGLLGGLGAAVIMGGFEDILTKHALLFFFTPLIAAMAGNVGVQSSAIIVQGLANDDIKGGILPRVLKEMLLALFNGIILAVLLFACTWIWKGSLASALAISISLIVVIIIAGIIGTFTPMFLHKNKIDPALATGPFITTCNDIFGILIYFWIAKLILGI